MKYLLLCLCLCWYGAALGQDISWKQHEKIADEMMAKGQYAPAADNYELAWEQKPSKKILLSKAADAYRKLRNYRKAANAYKSLLGDKEFPLANLHYGRCLKQDGQYQMARTQLQAFLDSYNGDDQATLLPLVREDLRGCGLAQEWSKQEAPNTLRFLSGINTNKDEFAPLAFSDDILYFSSTQKERARIFRSQRKQGQFSFPVEPDLPRTPGGHFCHGTFTPDNERFYFTVCQGDQAWQGVNSKCDLYVTMREQNTWSAPQKMRDYVKMDGTRVTHPFVMHQGDTEILYFSSDRSGGQGGMDIWFMSRQIVGKDIDFTYPINAGSMINSAGDEVTPFYDTNQSKLYFSSNGKVNIGGFDVFVADGAQQNWKAPKNMGLPVNSSADDYYYYISPSGNAAFMASNRIFGAEKMQSTNDDLFYIGQEQTRVSSGVVSGTAYDKTNNQALSGVEIAIYEKVDDGLKRLLKSEVFDNGQYEFPILPEREFLIEASKDGYVDGTFEFNTYQYDGTNPGKALYLEKRQVVSRSVSSSSSSESMASRGIEPRTEVIRSNPSTRTESSSPPTRTTTPTPIRETPPVKNPTRTTTPNTTSPDIAKAESRPKQHVIKPQKKSPAVESNSNSSAEKTYTNSRFKKDGVTTNAPRHQGTYFKVQLSVVIDYNQETGNFASVNDWGRLDTEYIIEKGWTRVLLADFFDLDQARQVMEKAKLMGFPEAFIVRYVDGYRKN